MIDVYVVYCVVWLGEVDVFEDVVVVFFFVRILFFIFFFESRKILFG